MSKTKVSTWTVKFDEELLLRLKEYYKLPWWKRVFKKPPTKHINGGKDE